MVNNHGHKLLRKWRSYLATTNIGAQEIQTLGKYLRFQARNNPVTIEIREDMEHMRTEMGLVLNYVSGGTGKVNMVNYLTRSPQPVEEYYYEENVYVVNYQTGVFTTLPRIQHR